MPNEDIVPGLNKKLNKVFYERLANAPGIKNFIEQVKIGTATHEQTQIIASFVSKTMSQTMLEVITPGVLPSDRLYYNIAQRTLLPLIGESHALITQIASQVQKTMNQLAEIGIKPIEPPIDMIRLNRYISALQEESDFASLRTKLGGPLKNIGMSFADNFMKANAEFAKNAGLEPMIYRHAGASACKWCKEMTTGGPVSLDSAPKGVFARHDNCNCVIIYTSSTGQKSFAGSSAEGKPQALKEITELQTDEIYEFDALVGILSELGEISNISTHAINEALLDKISSDDIKQALLHPIGQQDMQINKDGEPSIVLIGERASVAVNPDTLKIATIFKTDNSKRNHYE